MRIDVHIERLVLEGLPVEQRDAAAIQAAVEGELAALLAEQAPGASGAVAARRAPSITLRNDAGPDGIGRQIAGAVHRGLGR